MKKTWFRPSRILSFRRERQTCKLDNERGCYRLNICVSPSPKSICWNPAPPNDGASGRWLDREGEWGWMNPAWMGFALITKTPASSPSPSAMRGCSKKTQLSVNQEAGPHLTPYLPTPWSWTSQPPGPGLLLWNTTAILITVRHWQLPFGSVGDRPL